MPRSKQCPTHPPMRRARTAAWAYDQQVGWLGLAIIASLTGCGRRNFNVDASDADGANDGDGGERANYVFVTSTVHDGNLGGLAGADSICQQRASEAALP